MPIEKLAEWLALMGALYTVLTFVLTGYILYFKSQKRRMEDAMTALNDILTTHAERINTLERESVKKEDQRRIDDSLKGEIAALRGDISHLRDQQHEDSMAVVRSISDLQRTVTTTLANTIAGAIASAFKAREG